MSAIQQTKVDKDERGRVGVLPIHTRELDTRGGSGGGSGAAHREIKAKLSSSKPPLNQGIVYALNITPSFPVQAYTRKGEEIPRACT